MVNLSRLEKHLLNEYQQGMPLSATPFADIASQLRRQDFQVSEQDVISCFENLQERGLISRVGAVLKPQKVGASTLAAVAAPEHQIDKVAALINSFPEVNHNYLREHDFNIWFVVTAETQQQVQAVLKRIEQSSGLTVLDLPMEEDFHIDLGFPLWC